MRWTPSVNESVCALCRPYSGYVLKASKSSFLCKERVSFGRVVVDGGGTHRPAPASRKVVHRYVVSDLVGRGMS